MPPTLTILIVGAGLAGFSASIQCALAGHTVTILESTHALSQIGAGLQLTPNATRLLHAWGVYRLLRGPCEPRTCSVLNYKGALLAHEDDFADNCRRKYGAPFADCHRVDLQRALVARAGELGVRVVTGARVTGINFEFEDEDDEGDEDGEGDGRKKALVLAEGPAGGVFKADLVVAADGLWSTCRSLFLGRRDAPLATGDLAYRIVLREEQIRDEEVRKMVREPGVRFWIGPDAHVVAYSLRGGSMYNVVLLVPDDLEAGVSRTEGSVEEMRTLFEGWDPVLTRILSYVDHVDKWKLMHRPPLPTWINPSHNFVLIGDACHPMLPYLAQGANSSIEDGAVLGLLLAPSPLFRSKTDLPRALQTFETLRKARGEAIARETFAQRRDFHLRDGEEQRARDELMLGCLGGEVPEGFPSRWTDPRVQGWLYGYDAMREVVGVVGGGR